MPVEDTTKIKSKGYYLVRRTTEIQVHPCARPSEEEKHHGGPRSFQKLYIGEGR